MNNYKTTVVGQNGIELVAWEKALKLVLYGVIGVRAFEIVQYALYRSGVEALLVKLVIFALIMGSLGFVIKGLGMLRCVNRPLKASFFFPLC